MSVIVSVIMNKIIISTSIIILISILITTACTTTRVVERVKIDTIKVASPIIEDSLIAKVLTDTVIVSNKVIQKDTVIDVRYYPLEKKFYVKVKPDTVTLLKIDTVQTTIEMKEENKMMFKDYLGIVLLLIVVLFVIWLLGKSSKQ